MAVQVGTVPGTIIRGGDIQNTHGSVTIGSGIAAGEIEFRTDGLVVAISGGSNLPQADPICYEAQKLALGVVARGGVLINGGENCGTMLAVTSAAQDHTLGIVCPYHEVVPFGAKVVVNSYQTRKILICIMPQVVVFPGQVGTLDELMTTIGWIKSLIKQNAIPPNLWVHNFWWDVIELLHSKHAIQPDVWERINKFGEVDEIIKNFSVT